MASRRTHRFLAAALVIGLGWRALTSATDLAREVTSQPLGRLWAGVSAGHEERVRLTLGREYELYEAVRAHVEAGQPLFVLGPLELEDQIAHEPASLRTKIVFSQLSALLYPLDVLPWQPGTDPSKIAQYSGPLTPFALDLGSNAGIAWEESFDAVARGDDYVLWRWRGGGG